MWDKVRFWFCSTVLFLCNRFCFRWQRIKPDHHVFIEKSREREREKRTKRLCSQSQFHCINAVLLITSFTISYCFSISSSLFHFLSFTFWFVSGMKNKRQTYLQRIGHIPQSMNLSFLVHSMRVCVCGLVRSSMFCLWSRNPCNPDSRLFYNLFSKLYSPI